MPKHPPKRPTTKPSKTGGGGRRNGVPVKPKTVKPQRKRGY